MNQWLETIFFFGSQDKMNSRRQVMGNNWSQDDLPFLFKQDSIKSLFSNKRLSKDSSGQLVWVEWLTVSTRSERTFLWLYHVTKESSKVATVFISCLCLMKVPEMNDNSLPAVYIKKNVRSSTRNSVCNSFLLYCLSGIQS